MTWTTGTGTDVKDLLDKLRADCVTHGWTVDSYQLGDGKATGLLTLTANAANTETVTIDTKVYTFQTVLTDVDGNVLIGATASDSIDNLIAAIVLGAGAGTKYATSMTVHPTVVAAVDAGDTMLATAKTGGTAGNSIALAETLAASGSVWDQAFLTGGLIPLEDPDVLYMHGDGPTGTENVHVNIKTGVDITNGKYWWEIRGAILYDSALAFESQPGVSPASFLLHWSGSLPYWLSVNDRRFIIEVKSSTRYFSAYGGFFLPYATPIEYPYPLYIGATEGINGTGAPAVYTETGSEIRNPFDPTDGGAYMREASGSWVEVWCHGANNANDDAYTGHNSGEYFLWPHYLGSLGSQTEDLRSLDIRTPPGLTDAVPILPFEMVGDIEDMSAGGILEGGFRFPGFGASAEQTFTLDALKATAVLTLTGNALNTETVVIGAKTYTFQDTLTDVDGNVHIGATASDTLDNLIAAIGLRKTSGTDYAQAMTIHPEVYAEAGAGDTMDIWAKSPGTAGNALVTTETLTNGSWGATLSGGAVGISATGILTLTGQPANTETVVIDAKTYTFQTTLTDVDGNVHIGASASASLDNLIAAIELGAGAGTDYATSMTLHPTVVGSAEAGDTMGATAKTTGTAGNSIVTTTTITNGSWGDTMFGGTVGDNYIVFPNVYRVQKNHFHALRQS